MLDRIGLRAGACCAMVSWALSCGLIEAAAQAPAQSPARQQAAPARAAGSESGADVIARVGDKEVTIDDLRAHVAMLDARQQAELARDQNLISQVVRAILANQLVLQEARAKRWDQEPSVVALLQRARDSTLAESYLHSISAPAADFPSDAELQATYDANKSAFLVPRQYQVGQIFVALAGDADKATEESARKKIAEIQRQLKRPGADFAAIARANSDAKETAQQGGEIGWVSEAQLRPEIRALVVGLAKHGIAEPHKLDDGWHILKLLDTKPASTRPLVEVRDALVQRLRAERADANRRAYLAELLRKTPPAINELALSKLFTKSAR